MEPEKKEAPVPGTSKEIINAEPAEVKDFDIDYYLATRKEFISKVNGIMVETKDYHVIQGKKSLAKGGAEKIASIYNWQASFKKDTEALEMLGDLKGLVAFICTLTKNDVFVGEGRGAASLVKNGGDPNKTLKMAQKSAYIDAVIRTSGLSDFFTQDLEDMDEKEISKPLGNPNKGYGGVAQAQLKPSDKQMELIKSLMEQKGITKEDIIADGFGVLTGGKAGTASELIDYLLKAKSRPLMERALPIITLEQKQEIENLGDQI